MSQPLPLSAVVTGLAFAADGRRLATASLDNPVQLWDIESGRSLRDFGGPGLVRAVALSPDGTRIASARPDRGVGVWDVETGESVVSIDNALAVTALAFSRDGQRLAIAQLDAGAQVWNTRTGEPMSPRMQHTDQSVLVTALVFSPDGKSLATVTVDKKVFVWRDYERSVPETGASPASGTEGRPDFPAVLVHRAAVMAAAFASDGEWLVTVAADNTLRWWPWRTKDTIAAVCARLLRDLTADEWRTCEKLPEG
jgi:WD40 repeat protein